MAPGHRDFTDYTTPGLCLGAVMTTRAVLRNSLAAIVSYDTLRRHPLRDTLPAGAVQIARACSAKFTLENTNAKEWGFLFNLAVLEGNDSLAKAVLARRLAGASSGAARDTLVLQALQVYLNVPCEGMERGEPARPELADPLVASLDAPDVDLATQLRAHMLMLEFAQQTNDQQRLHREVAHLATLAQQAHERGATQAVASRDLSAAYQMLMRMAFFQSADSMQSVAQQAQRTLRQLPNVPDVCSGWPDQCRTASVETIEATLKQGIYGGDDPAGTPAETVHETFWFPKGGVKDTIAPIPGHVTLLWHLAYPCFLDEGWLLWFNSCQLNVDELRRWINAYTPRGLAVVILQAEYGHSMLSGVESPAQEAERIRWYFQDYQQLPVTVAVHAPDNPVLPLPDGRHLGVLRNDRPELHYGYQSGAILIGADGKELYRTDIGDNGAPEIGELIQKALHSPAMSVGRHLDDHAATVTQ